MAPTALLFHLLFAGGEQADGPVAVKVVGQPKS